MAIRRLGREWYQRRRTAEQRNVWEVSSSRRQTYVDLQVEDFRPLEPTKRIVLVLLEAAIGIEPMNKGFADLCLTTWLRRLFG